MPVSEAPAPTAPVPETPVPVAPAPGYGVEGVAEETSILGTVATNSGLPTTLAEAEVVAPSEQVPKIGTSTTTTELVEAEEFAWSALQDMPVVGEAGLAKELVWTARHVEVAPLLEDPLVDEETSTNMVNMLRHVTDYVEVRTNCHPITLIRLLFH